MKKKCSPVDRDMVVSTNRKRGKMKQTTFHKAEEWFTIAGGNEK